MDTPDWIEDGKGREIFQETAGKTTFSARKIIVDALRESGDLDGEPTPTKRMTNFYEKGDKPRNRHLPPVVSQERRHRPATERRADRAWQELNFHPTSCACHENWVHGLNGDWLISRQRFFGVPFLLWYPVKEDGTADYDHPIVPSEDILPIDPPTCRKATARTSVMRAGRLHCRTGHHGHLGHLVAHPADRDPLRSRAKRTGHLQRHLPDGSAPAGQDIIRTWLFSSVDRAHLENKCLPWANATLSGWIPRSDHKKMSKSKGNVVVPTSRSSNSAPTRCHWPRRPVWA